ncbi:tetratricopeptide repeat protein [Clostridium lundense]|uniref:tetratricopeptide repeat protein n=1 Tax=Clostridium lundense TaxID=319475 RepID=UPI00068892F8|nr:hypothetical protein [Clostridium lundense]
MNLRQASNKLIDSMKKFPYKSFVSKNKNVILGVLVALVIGGGLIGYKITSKNKYSIATNKGEQYFYAADFNKSIEEYTILYNKDKSPLWKAKIAQVYSVKGDIENSRKYINECKGLDKKTPEVLNYIVFTEYMNKDFKEALKDGQEALKDNPQEKSLIKTMFAVYMANNKYEEAKKLLTFYPVDEKSSYDVAEYGRMLMVIGEKDKGFKNLRKAWDIDKDEYKIYDALVQIAMYDKNQILQDINKLSSKNPQDVAYKMWQAKIYSMSKDTASEASKIMESIKDKDLGEIERYVIEASIYDNTKQGDKAQETINKILKENKNDYRILHTVAWFYLNKKDLDKAQEYCKKSLYKNQEYPDNYAFLMPEILRQKGKGIEGEPYFRTAMLKEPYNYNIMLNIASYYSNTTDNINKALEYYKFAQIVKPDDAEIKYNIALIYLSNKKDTEAIKVLGECIKLRNDVPKYHRTLGTIYFLQGKTKEAIKEIRFAYDADKNDPLTLNNAGCYYIMVPVDLQRGVYNLQAAYQAIDSNMDEYTKKTIKENYEKTKKLYEVYRKSKGNEKLKIPELILFY